MAIDHNDDQQQANRVVRRIKSLENAAPLRNSPSSGGDAGHEGSGFNSIELGVGAVASATGSTAVGSSAEATATSSTSLGRNSQALDTESTAVGYFAVANGDEAAAFGYAAEAEADYATSLGPSSRASSVEGTAVGTFAQVGALHSGSTALGANSVTTAANQVMLGTSSDRVRVPGSLNLTSFVPSGSADSAGTAGDVTWGTVSGTTYLFVKSASGWRRVAMSTF